MFVVPVVTLVGWIMNQPMNLNFRLFDTTILVLTVLIVTLIIQVFCQYGVSIG
jgi:Ca2+:H+ antiporter